MTDRQMPVVTVRDLFTTFLRIAVSGIGGALPHARHALVDGKGWLTDREFGDILATGQLLPGPNIVNVAIIVGNRFAGLRGVVAALCGVVGVPFVIVLSLGVFYREFSQWGWLQHAFVGSSAAAAGLIIGVGMRLARTQPPRIWAILVGVTAFGAIALLRIPMMWVVLALAPVAVLLASRGEP